jgi:hypothetical protein
MNLVRIAIISRKSRRQKTKKAGNPAFFRVAAAEVVPSPR